MSNALQNFQGAGDVGITPDDSPAIDEMLQGVTSPTEVASQPQGLQLKRQAETRPSSKLNCFCGQSGNFATTPFHIKLNLSQLERQMLHL